MKTAGIFHSHSPDPSVYGMIHEFVVTGEVTAAVEPTATLRVTISSESGIEMEGNPRRVSLGASMYAGGYDGLLRRHAGTGGR